jgi:hypothetical protein
MLFHQLTLSLLTCATCCEDCRLTSYIGVGLYSERASDASRPRVLPSKTIRSLYLLMSHEFAQAILNVNWIAANLAFLLGSLVALSQYPSNGIITILSHNVEVRWQ